MSVKELIDRYRWDPGKCISDLRICYIHRGAENDEKWVDGGMVKGAARGFMEIDDGRGGIAYIPFHRVKVVTDKGEVIFKRGEL